jgi:hypothetical protein
MDPTATIDRARRDGHVPSRSSRCSRDTLRTMLDRDLREP